MFLHVVVCLWWLSPVCPGAGSVGSYSWKKYFPPKGGAMAPPPPQICHWALRLGDVRWIEQIQRRWIVVAMRLCRSMLNDIGVRTRERDLGRRSIACRFPESPGIALSLVGLESYGQVLEKWVLCSPLQETQLSLTNRAMRLEVCEGHQTWYH